MKLGMVQMSMCESMDENEAKILRFCDAAKGCDLVFFPEVQYSPFFAQYESADAGRYLMQADGPRVRRLMEKARQHGFYLSPNVYLQQPGGRFDASLWITPQGQLAGISSMVHIFSAPCFYETAYYTPSPDGFHVYETPFGKVGIVICFDRHIPESVRTCAAMGAELVIIPTANMCSEPLDLFEAEVRTEAMQNQVFIAMCNRVGREGDEVFAGQSLIVGPDGTVLLKADGTEQLLTWEIDLQDSDLQKQKKPFISLRRPEFYR